MTRRGPPPQPTEIKRLRGNPGKRPLNDAEARFPVPRRLPSPPDYLSDEGAEIWRDLGKLLLDAGLFTFVDRYAFSMFCVSTGRWIKAEKELNENGLVVISEKGAIYQSPYLGIANRAWDQMRKMLGEFGLTPAERSRIKVAVVDDEPDLVQLMFQGIFDMEEDS